jgi:2-furoyl-CoA dehydrogenase large subunit
MPGVVCVVIGADARRWTWTRPLIAPVRSPFDHWCLAIDRVRYQGEPVAVVVAGDRYRAEDALEGIEVSYRALPATMDPRTAAARDIVSDQRFRYGDPEAAFAAAPHRVAIMTRYPRNGCTPLECFVVIAEYFPGEDAYEVSANFQGPFALHPVMALALGVPASRLRLKTPLDSGGSYGVKQAVFPYIVLMAIAARKAGRPVKWVDDRAEHLLAASSATSRLTTLEAAVTDRGEITALAWDQIEDCGAYLRAPEPASLYRMHGNMTGAYRVRNLAIRNRVVLTNKTPSGRNRGFGGPQVYFALERLMHRIAAILGLDPLGGVGAVIDSVPQGQGHRTVVAQVVGEVFDLPAAAIRVHAELDTGEDAWSIAAGNYSSRFAGAVAGAAHLAALRLRDKLAGIAASELNIAPENVRFANGRIFAAGNADDAVAFARLAGTSHWSSGPVADADAAALRETVFWAPPGLSAPKRGR